MTMLHDAIRYVGEFYLTGALTLDIEESTVTDRFTLAPTSCLPLLASVHRTTIIDTHGTWGQISDRIPRVKGGERMYEIQPSQPDEQQHPK